MSLLIAEDRSSVHVSQEGLVNEIVNKLINPATDFADHSASESLFSYDSSNSEPYDKTTYLSAIMSIMHVLPVDVLLATSTLAAKSQNRGLETS